MSFASMLGGLYEAMVDFVVVGGVAGAVHGSQRVTNDLDIVYDAASEINVMRLANLLARWKAYPRGVERGLPFLMDAQTIKSCPVLTLTTVEGDLDLLDRVEGIGDYRVAREHSQEANAFNVKFRVLDLPTLIKAKRAAGRPKDREALIELEALQSLGPD
jgi:hypothetical protein